ncbi:hypothetical protein H0H93_005660 [Arthromyces matolae]|nr:hypothetical protein H0H93_005660 [Arthromyces matolae]
MDSAPHARGRGRGTHSRNRQWVAGENGQNSGTSTPNHSDSERWERGGHRGGHKGRGVFRGRPKFSNASLRTTPAPPTSTSRIDLASVSHETDEEMVELEEEYTNDEGFEEESDEPALESAEEREKFWQSLVKAREVERKKAIAEGKMDDPAVPKRLEDAITVVGTCMDMCPRFERYRRERENNLFQWETIPGTKRVDHKRAVKMYERAAGDKTLPSDLRPPPVLKAYYLFHELLPRGGFSPTYDFIRDRSRAVRNDFTMQHSYGPEAIECHDRCARFHILALHLERDTPKFSIAMEEQQLMNTLQSLKEFYEDQRGRYQSPTELEMRVYHRLIHIRDQKERHEEIPDDIRSHPVFRLTTEFRLLVQKKSAPIHKTSVLKVDSDGMRLFGELAGVLRAEGNVVMIYLVACILERLFGQDAIDDIDSIRGDLSISDIIDGIPPTLNDTEGSNSPDKTDQQEEALDGELKLTEEPEIVSKVGQAGSFHLDSSAVSPLPPTSAFSAIKTTPNVFNTLSTFGQPSSSSAPLFGVPGSNNSSKAIASLVPSTSGTAEPNTIFGSGRTSFNPFTSSSNADPSLAVTTEDMVATNNEPSSSMFSQPSLTTISGSLPASSSLSLAPEKLLDSITPHVALQNFNTAAGTHASSLNPIATPFVPSGFSALQTSSVSSREASQDVSFKRSSTPSPSPSFPEKPLYSPIPTPLPAGSSQSIVAMPAVPTQKSSFNPPVLPKINTNTSNTSASKEPLRTPTIPPPPRPQLVSLPPTPSVGPPTKNIINFIKGNTFTPTNHSAQEVLSPLFMSSPTSLPMPDFSLNHKTPLKSKTDEPKGLLLNLNGKGKKHVEPEVDEEELESRSLAFTRKSLLVKVCLHRWHERLLDRIIWIEACRHSDVYKHKIKRQHHLSASMDKKRRISAGPGINVETSARKRTRRRVSSEYRPPRTDEGLAQRFKENHEEHERRWAQGSFLQVITTHVKSRLNGALPQPSWHIWLSMNPDSDATAIWLERKFDVPASGSWLSDAVFSIPLRRTTDMTSPGLIVFECTPMGGVADDLERKYRVLDDCARLRDIIHTLPPQRQFLPCLLLIAWTDEEQFQPVSDLTQMQVKQLTECHTIESFQTFSITSSTKDVDAKLAEILNVLPLDMQGKLVRALTIRVKVNWQLLWETLQAVISLINSAASSVGDLLSGSISATILPSFTSVPFSDNNSTYDHTLYWLMEAGSMADNLVRNLQSHRNIGQNFPIREFIAQLWDLAQSQVEEGLKANLNKMFHVMITHIDAALEAQALSYELQRVELNKKWHGSRRRSASMTADTETDLSSSSSKRRRLFSPVGSTLEDEPTWSLNENLTPSPPMSNVSFTHSESSSTTAVVTAAMLKALTRDVKKRYI